MRFLIETKGHYDFINITNKVEEIIEKSGVKEGIANIWVKGSTVGLTTMEYEEGIMEDLKNLFEKLAPEKANYKHHLKWGDHNGAAHLKSAIFKTDLTIPIENAKLCLGTWQQIVLIDFDERPREREVIIKIISEWQE